MGAFDWLVDALPIGPGLVKKHGRLDVNRADPRITDPSVTFPAPHAASHESGGSDELNLAQSQVTGLVSDLASKADAGDLPTAHASTHADGGSDEITISLAQVSASGAASGDVPKWSGSAWVPGAEGGGGGSGIPAAIVDAKGDLIVATAADTVSRFAVSGTNGRVLTEDSGEASGIKWGTNAAASRLWTPGSGVTTADEFDGPSLAGAWTRVDKSGGTGRATWTQAAGCLSLLTDGTSTTDSGAELHGLVQSYALSVGEYIETHITWAGKDGNYPIAGLVIADGATFNAGTQVFGGMFRSSAGGADIMEISPWTNWSTRGSFIDAAGPGTRVGPYLRLKRTATNDYALYTSPDGVSWALLNTRTGVSFTPAYVGFACSLWGAAVQFAWSFAYFRIGS